MAALQAERGTRLKLLLEPVPMAWRFILCGWVWSWQHERASRRRRMHSCIKNIV